MATAPATEGSIRGLRWATAAFGAGVLLNIDRVPPWTPVAALVFIVWRLLAASRSLRLPGTWIRSLLALLLVAGVLVRFHTLNGLSAGTALLLLMGGVKLLETRAQRDQYIVVGAGLFLLLAACLDRQSLIRAPLYLLQLWLCCAALAVVAYAPSRAATASAGSASPPDFNNRSASCWPAEAWCTHCRWPCCCLYFFRACRGLSGPSRAPTRH